MVKNQRNSCCHMGCPPMFVNLHFHRGYSLGPQKSKPLIIYGIVSRGLARRPAEPPCLPRVRSPPLVPCLTGTQVYTAEVPGRAASASVSADRPAARVG